MDMLSRFGLRVEDLRPSFDQLNPLVLSLDADGICYEASANAAHLETAIRRAKISILEKQYLCKCQEVRAHLTARGSLKAGRKALIGAKGRYQDNRQGTIKPPLLEATREALARPGVFDDADGICVLLHRDIEADDGIMQDSYNDPPNTVIYSPDKDLCICPSPWYDIETGRIDRLKPGDRYGWARYSEEKEKVLGHGTAFFWAQMLMGDTADNVRGLMYIPRLSPYGTAKEADPGCSVCDGTGYIGKKRGTGKCECTRHIIRETVGPVCTGEVISACPTEDDAANAVLDLYRSIDQNPLPEACMLWLLRNPEDTAEGYIWSLGLSSANRAFIEDCYNRGYRLETQQDDGED